MSFLKSLFDTGGGTASPARRERRTASDGQVGASPASLGRSRAISAGSASEASRGLLRYLSGTPSSLNTVPPPSSSRGADDSSKGFFRRLSSSSSTNQAGINVFAVAVRDEILHNLNHVLSEMAVQAAEALEVQRLKDPEADLTHLHTGLKGVPEEIVEKLCTAVEQACFHGIRAKEFKGFVPFYDMVEEIVERSTGKETAADGVEVLRLLVDKVRANALTLQTPVGMSRSFLRHAINDGVLEQVLSVLTSSPLDLKPFYEPEALLLHGDSVSLLLTTLASLEHYDLSVDADDVCLAEAPQWPLIKLTTTLTTTTPTTGMVMATDLVESLEKWRLQDDMENIPLERFKRSGSFNSSSKRLARRDRLLDNLLLRSGGTLRHYMGSSDMDDTGDEIICIPRSHYLFAPGTTGRREGEKLLGQSLVSLVRDPRTCRMAVLEPALGVPFIFEEMLDFLTARLDIPQILCSKVGTSWRWPTNIARSLQDYQEVPPDSDPYMVAATLLYTLRALPNPLLTFERYHAFLACTRLPKPAALPSSLSSEVVSTAPAVEQVAGVSNQREDDEDQKRYEALRLVVNSLPLEHKPTLQRLMEMLHTACCGSMSHESESLPEDVAPIFSRAILRSYAPDNKATASSGEEAAEVVRLLIRGYHVVFADMKAEEPQLRAEVVDKMKRVKALSDRTKGETDETDPHCLRLLEELFRFLARVERRREGVYRVSGSPQRHIISDHGCDGPSLRTTSSTTTTSSHKDHNAAKDTEEFTLDGMRWEVRGEEDEHDEGEALNKTCGFVRGNLTCELGEHRLLALECLVYFTKRFPNVAAEMLFQYAHHGCRGQTISFEAACAQVLRVVLKMLRLVPPADGSELSVATFSDAGWWRIFKEAHVIEEVFCASLSLLDFLHYHEVIPLDLIQVHVLEVKRQLSWALSLGPQSLQAMWELWLAIRLQLQLREREGEESADEQQPVEDDEDDEDEVEASRCSIEGDMRDEEGVAYKTSRGVKTKIIGRSDILQPWHVTILEPALPEVYQNYDWVQLYSLKRHGASIKTLFSKSKWAAQSMLVVMDAQGTVMGGFATEPWRESRDRYYGSGETFLFTFKDGRFVKYTWTRANSYFMLSSAASGIALGGGGHFGLYLDQDLSKGSSDHCLTFGSHCLSHTKAFDVVAVELWGFRSPVRGDSDDHQSEQRDGDGRKSLVESLAEMDITGAERPC